MFKSIINTIKRSFIKVYSKVIINKNNTYYGLTGKEGIVFNMMTKNNIEKLYIVSIDGFKYPFLKEALDLK